MSPEACHSLGSVGAFFECVDVLVYRELIDRELVGELMSRHIILFWEKTRSMSYEMRRRLKVPADLHLEHLYNQMKPMADR